MTNSFKQSRYNHHGDIGGGVFLYNLATSAVAVVNHDEFEQIESAEFSSSEVQQMAVENGFVVPKDENEIEKILAVERVNNYSTRFAGFQVLPTTACNARCFYCYEQGYKPVTMNDSVLDAIPSFISGYMDMVDHIHITWFGGEPLLGMRQIETLTPRLLALAKEHGVSYTSDIITNATLASRSMVERLVGEYRVSQAQITLDGLEAEHMRRKQYQSKDITYEGVLSAMDAFVDFGANLLIRLNVDKRNLEDCIELIGILGERYASRDNVMLYAAPLYGAGNQEDFFGVQDLNAAYKPIFRKMIDVGFIQTLDGLPLNFNNATCSAQMINNYVITPEGDVYKCEHLLASAEEKVGTVFDGVWFNEAMSRWASPDVPNACRECSYLPSCQAGCYAAEALDFGLRRCPHIAYIEEAILDAAGYLLAGRLQDEYLTS